MLFTIQLDHLDHADAVRKAIPLLEETVRPHSTAVSRTIAVFGRLPEELFRQVFDAIPDPEKNGIIADFICEYGPALTAEINRLCAQHRFGVTLSDLFMAQELQLNAQVESIDYLCIAEQLLPVLRQALLNHGGTASFLLRPLILSATAAQICTLLDRILGAGKDAFLVNLLNQNQHLLIPLIEKAAAEQGVRLSIRSLSMQL